MKYSKSHISFFIKWIIYHIRSLIILAFHYCLTRQLTYITCNFSNNLSDIILINHHLISSSNFNTFKKDITKYIRNIYYPSMMLCNSIRYLFNNYNSELNKKKYIKLKIYSYPWLSIRPTIQQSSNH